MSRTSALLWLALVLGSFSEPARCETPLAGPVEQVRKHLNNRQIDEAIDAGEQAVEALQQDSYAWFWLARAYAQQAIKASLLGKPRWAGKAREAYEKSVELDPNNFQARFDLTQYYLAAPGFLGGSREKAGEQVSAIEKGDPVLGKLGQAELARHDEQPAQVEKHLRDALKLDAKNVRARVWLAMHLQVGERWAEIRALWDEVLASNPDDELAHYQLGRLSSISGEALEAGLTHFATYLAKPKESDSMTIAGAHWRRGLILEKLGRRDEAIAAIEESLRLNPDFEQAQTDLDRLRDA